MDRSLRRRGQVLVVVGVLLGAVSGVVVGLAVEDAQPSTAVAASGHARGAARAAGTSSSHPPASQADGSGNRTDGNPSPGNQPAESADRPDKQHGNAGKDRKGGRDKPGGHGKDHPGKGKGKSK